MTLLFDINISELTSTVKASAASMMDPRNTARREQLVDKWPQLSRSALHMYRDIITPIVTTTYMRLALGDIRERFEHGYEVPDCLRAYGGDEAVELSHGVDGVVYKLPDGSAAKLGLVRAHHEDPIPDPNMERVKLEIELARLAGKKGISPAVKDSFFCCSRDSCFYVIIMEAVNGPTLSKWLRKATPEQSTAMRKKIAALLKRLHALGIAHMDLHAGNVMVGEDGEPLIIDFSRSQYHNQNKTDLVSLSSIFDHMPSHVDILVDLVIVDLIDMGKIRIQ